MISLNNKLLCIIQTKYHDLWQNASISITLYNWYFNFSSYSRPLFANYFTVNKDIYHYCNRSHNNHRLPDC